MSRTLSLSLVFLVACACPALAATRSWTGAGPDNSTATAMNWSGNTLPVTGDDVIFPAGVAKTTVSSTLFVTYHSVTFATTGGAVYNVSGLLVVSAYVQVDSGETDIAGFNPFDPGTPAVVSLNVAAGAELKMQGTIVGAAEVTLRKGGAGRATFAASNNYSGPTRIDGGTLRLTNFAAVGPTSSYTVNPTSTLDLAGPALVINVPMTLSGATVNASENAWLTGAMTLAGNTVFSTAAAKTLLLQGTIGGPATFTKSGPGDLTFAGTSANTFGASASPASIIAGTMHLSQGSVGSGKTALPQGLVIGDLSGTSASVLCTKGAQIQGDLRIRTGGQFAVIPGVTETVATLTTDTGSSITLAGSLIVNGGTSSSAISGAGVLVKATSGTLSVSSTSTFTGTVQLVAGSLVIYGILPATVNVAAAATLQGSGTVGVVHVAAGGTIAGGSSPQSNTILHTQSLDLTTTANASFVVRPADAVPVPLSNRLAVTGTVTLGNATLNLTISQDVEMAPGLPLILIDNDGTDPVVGTFAGLPEGTAISQFGRKFSITYKGGDGNDVALVPAAEYYLSEGSTGGFFTTDILIANPNTTDAPIAMTFFTQANGTVVKTMTVPAMTRRTVTLNAISEIGEGAVSTIVTSTTGLPLVVERTMTWDKSGYGSHGEKAVNGPALSWFFGEGSQGFFSTYLLLANPQTAANTATVTYYREGDVPLTRTYALDPQSRMTIDMGADAGLVGRSFGMGVQFTAPGVAERAMYFGTSPLWNGGHESAGVNQPATSWLLAEGATGPFFETFILLANPGDLDATATVTFMPAGGSPITKTKLIPAQSRLTINIEPEDPALANAAVATRVVSDRPIVAERSQYWPDPAPQWYEAHNSFGITSAGKMWGLAEGRVGQAPGCQTYILLQNPGATAANVTIRFLRENGGATITKTFVVPATGRLNVSMGPGTDVPELVDENFGAMVSSDWPIAVERSMYSNANGQIWAAGTNVTATRLIYIEDYF
jgi:autotransporter-associated beta strand protein